LRKAGQVTREIQNTSQSFIREMERAADVQDAPPPPPYDPAPVGEKLAEPRDALEHAMAYPEEATHDAEHPAAAPAPAQPEVAGPVKPHPPSADPAPY
jgi:hypothetical protein